MKVANVYYLPIIYYMRRETKTKIWLVICKKIFISISFLLFTREPNVIENQLTVDNWSICVGHNHQCHYQIVFVLTWRGESAFQNKKTPGCSTCALAVKQVWMSRNVITTELGLSPHNTPTDLLV